MSFALAPSAVRPAPGAQANQYLTDGTNLFRVIWSTPGLGDLGPVVLEDCSTLALDAYTVEAFRSLALTPVPHRIEGAETA